MSLEMINSFATIGTLLVIAATAIAAIVQLRHARTSNYIAALNELRETTETSEFRAALHFVYADLPAKLKELAFRYQLAVPEGRTEEMRPLLAKVNTIGNFYENVGVLVRTGLVDQELVNQIWCVTITSAWDSLAPVAVVARRKLGDRLWENFEYLAVLAQDWMAKYPRGTYPAGVRRIELKDEWLETDEQYAASLAPA